MEHPHTYPSSSGGPGGSLGGGRGAGEVEDARRSQCRTRMLRSLLNHTVEWTISEHSGMKFDKMLRKIKMKYPMIKIYTPNPLLNRSILKGFGWIFWDKKKMEMSGHFSVAPECGHPY